MHEDQIEIKIDISKSMMEPKKAFKVLGLFEESTVLEKYLLVENFLLLTTKSRRAAYFNVLTKEQLDATVSFAKKLGLGFESRAFRLPLYEKIPVRAYTFTREDAPELIEKIHYASEWSTSLSPRLMFLDLINSHKIAGDLVEYTRCDINTYVEECRTLFDPDWRIQAQIKDFRERGILVNPECFFVHEFVPCKTNCESAATKGRKYWHDLRTQVNEIVAEMYGEMREQHVKYFEEGKSIEMKRKTLKEHGYDFLSI